MAKRANHPWRRFFAGRKGYATGGTGLAELPGPGPEGQAIAVESGLREYLKQINDAPLLTAERERELGGKIRAALDALDRLRRGEIDFKTYEQIQLEAQRAREEMVRSNLRLVVNIAKQFAGRGLPLPDLIEEGNLGLLRAVEGYDPSQNTRFSTYASWWIKQAIKRALINSVQPIHIPAYMVEEIARWKQAQAELEDRLGRPPTVEEICQHLRIKPRRARIIRKAIQAMSSPARNGDEEEGLALSEMIADDRTPRPDEVVFSEAEAELVRRLLDRLSEREAKILRMRFGLDSDIPLSLSEVAEEAGSTVEHICSEMRRLAEQLPEGVEKKVLLAAFDPAEPQAMSFESLASDLQVDSAYLRQRLLRLYERLDGPAKLWLGLRLGLISRGPMTLKQIGKRIGLTRERVRQIEREALQKLNKMLTEE